MNADDVTTPQWIYMAVAQRNRGLKKSPPTTRRRTVLRWYRALKRRCRDEGGWVCRILAVKA